MAFAIQTNQETCSHPSECSQPGAVQVLVNGVTLGFCEWHADSPAAVAA